jgi:uncharacterized protein (DUF697 family)
MSSVTEEGLAGIRLLVCMARADGVMHADERFALEDALAGLKLPEGITSEKLIDETHEPVALAKLITSPEGRDYTYASVFSLAHCDRHLHAAEQKILDVLRAEWQIKPEEDGALAGALDAGRATQVGMPRLAPVADPKAREAEFNSLLTRYSILTAVTGAIPVPLVPDLLVVPMQIKLVYDVAGLFGQATDKKSIQLMFETLGVGTGCRLGVSVISKFVPGWGSVVGATTAYATTYALGKVAWTFFQNEGKTPIESLKPLYKAEKEHGKQEYQKHKAALEEAQAAHADKLKHLAFELQQGKITQQQYEERVDALS